MDNDIDVYPNGFITSDKLTKGDKLVSNPVIHPRLRDQGSKTIRQLMDVFKTGSQSLYSVSFSLKVLEAAMFKLGYDPAAWFVYQYEKNDFVYDTNLAFLNDTVKYLVTGQRDISVQTWSEMIIRNPSRRPGAASATRAADVKKILNRTFPRSSGNAKLYQTWVSQKDDGVVDLLWTLFILFGQSVVPHGTHSSH